MELDPKTTGSYFILLISEKGLHNKALEEWNNDSRKDGKDKLTTMVMIKELCKVPVTSHNLGSMSASD